MKIVLKCFMAALALAALQGGVATADIVITGGNAEPTADVLLDASLALSNRTNTFINPSAPQGARGSGFSLASTPGVSSYNVSGLTLDAQANTLAAGFEFKIAIFDGNPYNLTFTAPGGTTVTSADYASATGLALIGEETVTVGAAGLTTVGQDFITLNFDNDIQVDADSDLSVMVFTSGAFGQREGNGNANAATPTALNRVLFNTTSVASPTETGSSRDFRFLIHGTPVPVPEPTSLALLGLAGIGMVARRRRS